MNRLLPAVLLVLVGAALGWAAPVKALKNKHSGLCAQAAKSAVVQGECTGGDHEKWALEDAGGGILLVKNAQAGKCLRTGTPLSLGACTNEEGARWSLDVAGGGHYYLREKAGDRCAKPEGGVKKAGTRLTASPCTAHDSSKWRLE